MDTQQTESQAIAKRLLDENRRAANAKRIAEPTPKVRESLAEILVVVYSHINRAKIQLAFNDNDGAFKVLNELSDYVCNMDIGQPEPTDPPCSIASGCYFGSDGKCLRGGVCR